MRLDPAVIDEVKRATDLVSYIASKGIKLRKNGKDFSGLCPFHKDTKPSLIVDPAKQLWNCLGACSGNGSGKRSGGDIITFVMKYESCSFREALQILSPLRPIAVHQDLRRKIPALLSLVIDAYHRSFLESINAQEYISSRGIDPVLAKQYKAGYADGCLLERVSRDCPDWKLLQETGIITDTGAELMRGCVVFPLTAMNQFPVGFYGRSISKDCHLYLPGPRRGLFNWNAAKSYREIILTESIFDALSFIQAGYQNVLPIYGVHGFTPEHSAFLVRYQIKKVILALDNDEAGKKAAVALAEKFSAMHIAIETLELPAKDANELLQKEGVKQFKAIIDEQLKKEEPAAQTVSIQSAQPEIVSTQIQNEGELSITVEDRRYDLKAVPKKTYNHLRVALQLSVAEHRYLDTVDLLSARNRSGFAARCAAHFQLQNSIIEKDLYLVLQSIEEYQRQQNIAPKAAKPEVTESEKAAALKLLESPDLLDEAVADMEALGYVGEEWNKKLGYLIAVSRKLEEPLSAVILSQSGSGKSFLAEMLEMLTPPEEMKMFSRLTPAALYYMEKDALCHKFVIVEERTGSAEADYSIRTLQSRKKLILAAPIKDPATGKIATKEFEIIGPTAFLETTTSPRINHENSTRCFEMYLDESIEQTAKIQHIQRFAKTSEGRSLAAKRKTICSKHHNAQRLLRPLTVVMDFATALDFPKSWLRTRRDNLRFLNLIEVVAFLHQYQKEVKDDCIAANFRDYEIATKLAEKVLPDTLSDMKKPVADLLSAIEAYAENQGKSKRLSKYEVTFSRRAIRDETGLPNHRIKELFHELEELEYVEVERSPRGGSFGYRLIPGKAAGKLGSCLLSVEQLKEKLSKTP